MERGGVEKKVTKNEEIAESARDHREVLEYFIATPREFRPRSIVFCFVPHSPNPSSSAGRGEDTRTPQPPEIAATKRFAKSTAIFG